MKVYLGGIIEGSKINGQYNQMYRQILTNVLSERFPFVRFLDPHKAYPSNFDNNPRLIKAAWEDITNAVTVYSDLMLAYVPEASMGTAVELSLAKQAGNPTITISPMVNNWALVAYSDYFFTSLDDFLDALDSGALDNLFTSVEYETNRTV